MLASLTRSKLRPARWQKPPLSYQKRQESRFYEPVTPYQKEEARRKAEYARAPFMSIKRKIDNDEPSKDQRLTGLKRQDDGNSTNLKRLISRVPLDPNTGIPLDIGLENEIKGVLEGNQMNYSPFVDYFLVLSKSLGLRNDYELLGLFSHSIAMRAAPDMHKKAKGMLLGIAIEKAIPHISGLSDQAKALEVDKLTNKLATLLVFKKLRRILAGLQKDSSYERAPLIDYFLNDPRNPAPSNATKRTLIRQVYPASYEQIQSKYPDEEPGVDSIDQRLERNYLMAKARVLCHHLGVDENTVLEVSPVGVEIRDFDKLWQDKTLAEIEAIRTIGESNDERIIVEKRKPVHNDKPLKLFLKDLLSHVGVLNNLETKIVRLEDELNLYPVDAPTPGDVERQLDLLLSNLPPAFRSAFKLDEDFSKMRYLNNTFNAAQLQWNAVDLEVPAKIMRVEEHKRYEKTRYMAGELWDIYGECPEFLERLNNDELRRTVDPYKQMADETDLSYKPKLEGRMQLTLDMDPEDTYLEKMGHDNLVEQKIDELIDQGQTVKRRGRKVLSREEREAAEKAEAARLAAEAEALASGQISAPAQIKEEPEEEETEFITKRRRSIWDLWFPKNNNDFDIQEYLKDEWTEIKAKRSMANEILSDDGTPTEIDEATKLPRHALIGNTEEDPTRNSLFKFEIETLKIKQEDGEEIYKNFSPNYMVDKTHEANARLNSFMERRLQTDSRLLREIQMSSISDLHEDLSVFERMVAKEKSEADKYGDKLDRKEAKSIALYRQLQDPVYYKHYVAQSYRDAFELNPYDNQHFLDDRLNPNLGIYYDAKINKTVLADDLDETERTLKIYKPRLSVIGSSPKYVKTETPNCKVSTYPNFISTPKTPLLHDLYKLRPQEVEELQKPKMHYFGNGHRKTCKAVAVVTVPGTGKIRVNNRELIEYFIEETGCFHVIKPIQAAEKMCEVDVNLYVTGGGITAQSQASGMAVAKAMVRAFPDLYEMYSDGYFFFSDCRQVEPKATGRYKARKSWTYVRR